MNEKMQTLSGGRLLHWYIVVSLILLAIAVTAFFAAPAYAQLFEQFGTKPSWFGELLIASARYWWIVPAISISIALDIWRREESSLGYLRLVTLALVMLVITLVAVVPVSIWSLHLAVNHYAYAG